MLKEYALFGIRVQSEIPFPEFPESSGGATAGDPTISFVQAGTPIRFPKKNHVTYRGISYWESKRQPLLKMVSPRGSRFHLDLRRRKVMWSVLPEDRSESARLMLQGRVLGLMLPYLRPVLLLHGAVVSWEGKGMVLCAPSGLGKSTLAAALLEKGCTLLNDDVAVLHTKNGSWYAERGVPEVRLWRESLENLDLKSRSDDKPLYPDLSKRRLGMGKRGWYFSDQPIPIRTIAVLNRQPEGAVQLQVLRGQEAVRSLLQNSYNPFVQNRTVIEQQLDLTIQAVKSIPIHRIRYPSGYSQLAQVAEKLLQEAL